MDKPKLREITVGCGTLMTIEDFIACCLEGGFIDYDGMGNWATATHVDDRGFEKWIYPSQITNGTITPPDWATHVLWYNR